VSEATISAIFFDAGVVVAASSFLQDEKRIVAVIPVKIKRREIMLCFYAFMIN
jgi:hypothetical protein